MDHPSPFRTIAYAPPRLDPVEALQRATAFRWLMEGRRSVRHFSPDPVAPQLIDQLIRTASTAPSGAHKQPWTFCVVTDPALKQLIREAAEEEERANYGGRMPPEWLEDLAPLGTDANKEFLEIAPCLIVVFKQVHDRRPDGTKRKNYYVEESVGIACGFLLAAIRNAGLVALTHTPSPMNFLARLLDRPENERAFLLVPVGHPAAECEVPDLHRKELSQVLIRYDQPR
ncbi:MAG: nitroreductase family protein [Flavobacteriales bacterium]|nr:nitroreductase family protein [Flavobacteriales bacterium]MCB9178013.1 nitroreductase family protein [Flavobacteriales bacterium]HPF90316.1 nitroreductase family protein [Flavobacteriales bacterium]